MPSLLGSLARGGAGLLKPAVRSVGGAAARTGLMLGAAGLTFGAAAGVMAMGAGYALNRAASTLAGGDLLESRTHDLFGLKVAAPALSRGGQRAVVAGAVGVGAAAGALDGIRNGGWNVNQAISTGMLEVERPHFLGATGSLTIASSRRRKPQQEDGGYAKAVGLYGDDVLHLMKAAGGH